MAKLKAALVSSVASLLLLNLVLASELQLRQLSVVFRHGDRMPEAFPKRFPNDPNMHADYNPMGSGGLTNQGKRRMYRFGELLRRNYSDFLGSEYVESQVFGISSSVARTKMSLQLVLAGLYPPSLSSARRWHPTLDWQPIPVHYYDFRHDKVFNQDKCELFIDEFAKVYNSTDIQRKLEDYKSYLENLKIIVGKNSPITLNDILILHNNLEVEKKLNMTMESWMISALEDERLRKMRQLYYEIHGYNEKLRRIQSGYLIRKINEDMQKASNKSINYAHKVVLYSGHDKNLIGLFQSLNLYDLHFPEFSSALIFELLTRNETYYVKILYYLGIPEEIKILTLPGCTVLCPLDQFSKLTKPAQILDEEMNCKINSDNYFNDNE